MSWRDRRNVKLVDDQRVKFYDKPLFHELAFHCTFDSISSWSFYFLPISFEYVLIEFHLTH